MVKVAVSDEVFPKVTLLDEWNKTIRHTVDLVNYKCNCRAWKVTGKPCRHALAWILSNRLQIKDFVHEYYSVARFRAAYVDRVPPMPDMAEWSQVDLCYKLLPLYRRGQQVDLEWSGSDELWKKGPQKES